MQPALGAETTLQGQQMGAWLRQQEIEAQRQRDEFEAQLERERADREREMWEREMALREFTAGAGVGGPAAQPARRTFLGYGYGG